MMKLEDLGLGYNKISNIDSIKNLENLTWLSLNGNKIFDILGTDGNRYIIKELSIMNYEVYLDNYTTTIE